MKQRTEQLNIRVTPQERLALEASAKRQGFRGLADYLRAVAFAGRPPVEHAYTVVRWGGAAVFAAVVVALLISVAGSSSQALTRSGVGFLWSGTWNPAAGEYGAGILVVGTLLTTAVAMVIVVPIGLGTAAFLSEHEGAEFDGRITGVTRFGLFVRLLDTGADGLVPVSTLGKEYFA